MMEKSLIVILTVFYLGSFIVRNIIVKRRVKQPVRSRDPLLTVSIIFATLSFFVVILSVYSEQYYSCMIDISLLRIPFLSFIGLLFFGVSIVFGWVISSQLRDSWRVGVIKNQKTKLIDDGIYGYIRNPYFLSYYIMFTSLSFVRPSVVLLVLVLTTMLLFHLMVLKEEKHLLSLHGEDYMAYKKKAGRYLPQWG